MQLATIHQNCTSECCNGLTHLKQNSEERFCIHKQQLQGQAQCWLQSATMSQNSRISVTGCRRLWQGLFSNTQQLICAQYGGGGAGNFRSHISYISSGEKQRRSFVQPDSVGRRCSQTSVLARFITSRSTPQPPSLHCGPASVSTHKEWLFISSSHPLHFSPQLSASPLTHRRPLRAQLSYLPQG